MNKKINKNLIFLGAVALLFGFSSGADAAYVCDQYVGPGTNRIVTNCWNSNQVPSNSYGNTGGLGSSNENQGFGQQLGYVSDGGAPAYNGTPYNSNNNGSANGNGVNTTNTSNGVSTNNSSTNRTTTVARNTTSTNNKVATTSSANDNANNNVAGTTNVSNDGSGMSANGLTALSLEGSNNFLPDTVWEWICVFFLILVIVILIRQFKGKSGHDVHHATPHH
jgi:hypothetical protein